MPAICVHKCVACLIPKDKEQEVKESAAEAKRKTAHHLTGERRILLNNDTRNRNSASPSIVSHEQKRKKEGNIWNGTHG